MSREEEYSPRSCVEVQGTDSLARGEAEQAADDSMAELEAQMADELCVAVRLAAERVTGGNCAFVDDDLRILEHLATRAADAGLTDSLHPTVKIKTDRLAAKRSQATASSDDHLSASPSGSGSQRGGGE